MIQPRKPIRSGELVAALRPGRFDYSGYVTKVGRRTLVVRFGDGPFVEVPNRPEFVESMQRPVDIAIDLTQASGNGKRLEQDASDERIVERAGELGVEILGPYELSRIRWVLEQLWQQPPSPTGDPDEAG